MVKTNIPKKDWTTAEHKMIESLGYSGRTASSQVALSRQEGIDRAGDAAFDRNADKTLSAAQRDARDNR